MKTKQIILGLLSVFVLSTAAVAQPGPGMGRGMGPGAMQKFNQKAPMTDEEMEKHVRERITQRREAKLKLMKTKLNLTYAQATKIEALMKQQEARKIEHFKKMRALRREKVIQRQETELSILNLLDEDQKKEFAVLKAQRKMMAKKHRGKHGHVGGKGRGWSQHAFPAAPPASDENTDD